MFRWNAKDLSLYLYPKVCIALSGSSVSIRCFRIQNQCERDKACAQELGFLLCAI